jgi:hypothetical protein
MLNKIVGTALISAALYYFLSPRKASALYRNLLFHPSVLPDVLSLSMVEEAFGGSPEEVYFESAGKFAGKAELHGWFFQPPAVVSIVVSQSSSATVIPVISEIDSLLLSG